MAFYSMPPSASSFRRHLWQQKQDFPSRHGSITAPLCRPPEQPLFQARKNAFILVNTPCMHHGQKEGFRVHTAWRALP
jgi:hypothetical protein